MSVFEADEALNLHPGYVPGLYYMGYPTPTTSGSALPAIDTLYFCPVLILTPLSFDRIGVRVQTGAASALLKHGLWASDPTTKLPIGAPIVADDTGLDCSTSTSSPEVALSAQLAPGLYWWGSKSGHAPALVAVTNLQSLVGWAVGRSVIGANATGRSMAHAMATALPTLTGGETISDVVVSGIPLPWFRAA
jgi:hypothetical protein